MKRFCAVLAFILLINTFSVSFAASVSYNDDTKSVTLSGNTGDLPGEGNVTAMLVTKDCDRENLNPADIAYIGQTKALQDKSYSFSFAVPQKFDFDNLEVFVKYEGCDITYLLEKSYFSQKAGNITAYSDGQNVVYKSDSGESKTAYIAFFDGGGKLVEASVYTSSAEDEIPFPKNAADAKIFVWQNGTLLPYMSAHKIQRGVVKNFKVLFPQFTDKALTFSYDDGASTDGGIIELFDSYNIKATFNLINENDEYKEIYKNHEAASHSANHIDMRADADPYRTTEECISAITEGKAQIERMFGKCTGFVWPYTVPDERSDYLYLLKAVKENYNWARTVNSTGSFDLPEDWYNWNPTCHHKNMFSFVNDFLYTDTGNLKLFYIWGHTFEFSENYDNNRYLIEDFAKLISKHNVWKATNSQIYDYVQSSKALRYEDGCLYNGSDMDLYIEADGENILFGAKKTYYGKEAAAEYTTVFPGFAKKALTLSFDDGKVQDGDVAKILNENGLKATFYVNYKSSTYAERYKGHEVASHTAGHINMSASANPYRTTEECISAITEGKAQVTDMFGSCAGFAWPFGVPVTRSDYDKILSAVKENFDYARPVLTSGSFDIPSDFYDFKNTCRITELNSYTESFLEDDGKIKLLSSWGHSTDFDDSFSISDFETFCKKTGERSDIWKATNGQVAEYVSAARMLKADGTVLHNPSNIAVYIISNGQNIKIEGGGYADIG